MRKTVLSQALFNAVFCTMATIDWSKYDINEAREIARKFGKEAIARFTAKMHALDLVETGKLINSLKASVRSKDGEVDRINFSYEFYGAIWENGATNAFGKGITLQPRKWRNEVLETIKPELFEEFGEFYAKMIIEELTIDSVKLQM